MRTYPVSTTALMHEISTERHHPGNAHEEDFSGFEEQQLERLVANDEALEFIQTLGYEKEEIRKKCESLLTSDLDMAISANTILLELQEIA